MSSGIDVAANLILARFCYEQGFFCTSIVGEQLLLHRDGPDGEDANLCILDEDMAVVAAAPKLLAACVTARSALRLELATCTHDGRAVHRTTTQALDDLDTAIAKAEGGSS